jgi:TRAP-type C4-dicarboxylate transport system permease small subunit
MFLVRLNDRIVKALMVVAALWAFMLTFFIMSDIIGRGVFNVPLNGVREIVMNSIVIIVFLQAGYAIRSRSMLRADFILNQFPTMLRRAALLLCYLLGAALFLIILNGGIDTAIHAWVANEYEGEGALRVPTWPTKFVILLGAGLAFLNYLIMAYLDVFRPEALDAEVEDPDARFRGE